MYRWWTMAYPNAVFTTFAFLGFLMCLIPLPCHLRARSVGVCLYMFWAGAGCLMSGINSIVWNGNAINWSPIWCEISSRFIVASSFGIPASSLCINRRLYIVQQGASENEDNFNKNRTMIIDLVVGLALPLLSVPIYYISQGHRFNILEDIGCFPAAYNTWVSIVTLSLPPLLIGVVSATYAIRSLISINKMRTVFRQLLSGHSTMTYSLYFRLMALASVEIICTVPITTSYIVTNATGGRLSPWISWEDTHYDFDRVDQYPTLFWRSDSTIAQQIDLERWLFVVCAFLLFFFFGFAEEVRKLYGPSFQYVCKRMGIYREDKIEEMAFAAGSSYTSHSGDKEGTVINTFTTNVAVDAEAGDDNWSPSKSSTIVFRDFHRLDQ